MLKEEKSSKPKNKFKLIFVIVLLIVIIFIGSCILPNITKNDTKNNTNNNVQEFKEYIFENTPKYKILENVEISVTDFITDLYTNILKIKVDKTNYEGNFFEIYYKILNDNNKEIATIFEEEKDYDERIYNDELEISNISKNSKITIELYIKELNNDDEYKKVLSIPVDLSKAIEKPISQSNYKEYKTEDYSFKYKEDWKLLGILDENKVGPNSIYLGTLGIEIPSTTNSEYTSSIYVKTVEESYTQEEYINSIRKENTTSPSETYEEKNSGNFSFANSDGYQITSSISDGTTYIKKDYFTVKNGKVYRITFFGSELEYNNLKDEIDIFVKSFKILN